MSLRKLPPSWQARGDRVSLPWRFHQVQRTRAQPTALDPVDVGRVRRDRRYRSDRSRKFFRWAGAVEASTRDVELKVLGSPIEIRAVRIQSRSACIDIPERRRMIATTCGWTRHHPRKRA